MGLPDITPGELDRYRRFRGRSAEVIDELIDRVTAQAARIEQLELALTCEEMNES